MFITDLPVCYIEEVVWFMGVVICKARIEIPLLDVEHRLTKGDGTRPVLLIEEVFGKLYKWLTHSSFGEVSLEVTVECLVVFSESFVCLTYKYE